MFSVQSTRSLTCVGDFFACVYTSVYSLIRRTIVESTQNLTPEKSRGGRRAWQVTVPIYVVTTLVTVPIHVVTTLVTVPIPVVTTLVTVPIPVVTTLVTITIRVVTTLVTVPIHVVITSLYGDHTRNGPHPCGDHQSVW